MGRKFMIDAYFEVFCIAAPRTASRTANGYLHVVPAKGKLSPSMLSSFASQSVDIRYEDGNVRILSESIGRYQPVMDAIASRLKKERFVPVSEKLPKDMNLLPGEDHEEAFSARRKFSHEKSSLVYRGTLEINPSEWGGSEALRDMTSGRMPAGRTVGKNRNGHYHGPAFASSRYSE